VNCTRKLQIGPLVREGAPQNEDRKSQTVIKIRSWVADDGPTPRQTGRQTVGRNIDDDDEILPELLVY
jgi:hypothetical protein